MRRPPGADGGRNAQPDALRLSDPNSRGRVRFRPEVAGGRGTVSELRGTDAEKSGNRPDLPPPPRREAAGGFAEIDPILRIAGGRLVNGVRLIQ